MIMKITHHSKIPISRFYEEILGAKMNNIYWSWGAIDRASNRVFLKVWTDLIEGKKLGFTGKIRRLNLTANPNGGSTLMQSVMVLRVSESFVRLLIQELNNAK